MRQPSLGAPVVRPALTKVWYNHGNLPHFDQGCIFQVVTYRLADSLPQEYLKFLQAELESADNDDIETDRRKEIEELLDRGHGSCVLKNKNCAEIVEENWQHFNEVSYKLIAYVIMPNHVHVLINAYPGFELGKIVKSWKSYSSSRINELTGKDGNSRLWQRGYWEEMKNTFIRRLSISKRISIMAG